MHLRRLLTLTGFAVLASALDPASASAQSCSPQDICCGNTICDEGEDRGSCPNDCDFGCNFDGICEPEFGETKANCESDCLAVCPNTVCETDKGENASNCPQDCGGCTPLGCEGSCGIVDDGCGGTIDCGPCGACGNDACESNDGEDCSNCSLDCALSPAFTFGPNPAFVGQPVTFVADDSRILPGSVPLWDLGDGTHLPGSPLTHEYGAPGIYKVVSTITEAACGTTRVSPAQTITIKACSDCEPACPNPNNVCEPELGENVGNCPGECTEDCGDGTCQQGEFNRCPSDCPRTCDTVACDAGCALRPAFTISTPFPTQFQEVTFTALGENIDDPAPDWDFGDGIHCIDCPPTVTHRYERPGTYLARLTATENRCRTTQTSFPQTLVVSGAVVRRGDSARLLRANFPLEMRPGETFSVSVTMFNDGDTNWSTGQGYALAALISPDPFGAPDRIALPAGAVVGPKNAFTFQVNITAPQTEGKYLTNWVMVHENVTFFGDKVPAIVNVSANATPPPDQGDFTCHAFVHDVSGNPEPGKEVVLDAYEVTPDGPRLVASRRRFTGNDGRVVLGVTPPVAIQQLICEAYAGTTNGSPRVYVTDPVAIPRGTRLDLDVETRLLGRRQAFFAGLKPGNGVATLYTTTRYDRPIVIPMPFDPGEQTPLRFTERLLARRFNPLIEPAVNKGYDVWIMQTRTGQNIHEQAAEFAQLIDYASRNAERGKTAVGGYSLGGVTTRLTTARYQADPQWRQQLGVADELPANIVAFGDAPLEGAHINLCLQQGVWELGRQSLVNLNTCGAQQLLRLSVSGMGSQLHDANYRQFYENGGEVYFSPEDGVCDRLGRAPDGTADGAPACVCDAGPAVWSVNGDGWPHDVPLTAFSDGQPGTMMCYGDERDLDWQRIATCDNLQGSPHQLFAGEALFLIRRPGAADRLCYATPDDIVGGSRLGGRIDQRECSFGLCGGVTQLDSAGVFIPASSAVPASAPFTAAPLFNSFQGVHGVGYEPLVEWLLGHIDTAYGPPPPPGTTVRAAGGGAVDVTFPAVSPDGETTVTVTAEGPPPPSGYVPGNPPQVFDVATTSVYAASTLDPVVVCIDYRDTTYMDPLAVDLFHFEGGAWERVTSFVSPDGRRICGTVTSLSPFAIFEPANSKPIANAGPDQDVEATGPNGAEVVLNGAASVDPDRDNLVFRWVKDGQVLATTQVARVTLPLGTHRLVLEVDDGKAGVAASSVTIRVLDRTPPIITATANPALLWPPNGAMIPIQVTVLASDSVDPAPILRLVSVTATEAISTTDVAGAALGTDDRSLELRARRNGRGRGRVYLLTYSATDTSGNSATATASVTVPHDQRR